jgi:hypothetical protein
MTSSGILTPGRRQMNPAARAALILTVTVIVGVLMPWADENPPSPLFYPYIALLAVAGAVFAYRRPFPDPSRNDRPIETPQKALAYALLWGTIQALIIWGLYSLAWSDQRNWPVALMLGVLATASRYWHGRKLPHPYRAQIIAGAIVLGALVIVTLILRRV